MTLTASPFSEIPLTTPVIAISEPTGLVPFESSASSEMESPSVSMSIASVPITNSPISGIRSPSESKPPTNVFSNSTTATLPAELDTPVEIDERFVLGE